MLKENWRTIARIERAGDLLIILFCFFGSYYGRSSLIFWNEKFNLGLPFMGEALAPIGNYFIVLLTALLVYPFLLNALGAYKSMRASSAWSLLQLSLVASSLVFFTLAAILFLLKLDLSRSFIGLFCLLVGLTLTAERYVVLAILRFWRKRGRNYRDVLICGLSDQAVSLAVNINQRSELGIRIRGFVSLYDNEDEAALTEGFRKELRENGYNRPINVIKFSKGLEKALKDYAVDEVVFADVIDVMPQVEQMMLLCFEQGVRTTMVADIFSMGVVKSGVSDFAGTPLIHFQTPPGDRWELTVKRVVDLVGSLAALIFLSPIFLVIATIIKLSSPGPVFFVQKRVGLNGRLFDLYKFRSMYQDAEKRLEELKQHNEMSGPVFKMKDDPRVTPVGKFIRKYSLDELPQFWNVFQGDMSLVGPRPPLPGEVNLYERRERRRLSMRPGMTCIWQVSGRSEITDFETWVRLDLEYIDNWSLSKDFSLILRTIPVVFFGSGAR